MKNTLGLVANETLDAGLLREAATKKKDDRILLKIVEKIVLPLRLSTIISDTRIILTICMDRMRHHVKQFQCFCTTWDMMIITVLHSPY